MRRLLVLGLVVLLLPVPWRHKADSAVGLAWGLDRRLIVGGERLDPPGRYSWLTVGRPALVGELLWARARRVWDPDSPSGPRDLRGGSIVERPAHVEVVAAAVGLQRAGMDLHVGLEVHVSGPLDDVVDLPVRARLVRLNGIVLSDRAAWRAALGTTTADDRMVFTTADGTEHVAPAGRLPFERVEVVDVPPEGLTAAVGGHGPPYSWIRSMSMGSSHGLMVGLTTFAEAAGEDLAAGRHVAGTGRLLGDGSVGSIGGLVAKAAAARRAGADVLLVPADQAHLLAEFDPGRMRVVPVASIDEAIAALRASPIGQP